MEVDKIFEVFLYAVPAIITGAIAYFFFKEHTKNEDGRRRFLLHKDMQVNSMPLRLQAYEFEYGSKKNQTRSFYTGTVQKVQTGQVLQRRVYVPL